MPVMEDDYDESELFGEEVLVPKVAVKKRPVSTGNPLEKYYRLPGQNITLPTNGRYFREGEYEPEMNGEIEIQPMNAADELLLQSPDALMSGYAIENMVNSCIKSIKNARHISTPDLDAILIGVRAVTYGNNMDVDVKCPKCGNAHTMVANLTELLSSMTPVPEVNEVRLEDDLIAYIRPYNLENITSLATTAFNTTKTLQAHQIQTDMPSDEEQDAYTKLKNESMHKLSMKNISSMADCVIKIQAADTTVTDRGFINDFVRKANAKYINKLDEGITKMNDYGVNKKLSVVCEKCEHKWETELDFDPSNFFA